MITFHIDNDYFNVQCEYNEIDNHINKVLNACFID